MIWQNCFYVKECAVILAELPAVPVVIALAESSVDSVPVILQNCLYVEGCASDLAELPVPVIWQKCLYVEECAIYFAELSVPMVIWQNCLWTVCK